MKDYETKTINTILTSSVNGEYFQLAFVSMLEKLVNEYNDMSDMETIRLARELYDSIL